MRHIGRKRARQRAAGPGGEAATQWPDLLAALASGEVSPVTQTHDALAALLGELHALRQEPPPQVVVVVEEISALAEEACGPLGAALARRLEKGRSAGVALAVVGSRPTATWIT
jgi:DNA segregation ATPase FtsK/SpoIIIE-like protein